MRKGDLTREQAIKIAGIKAVEEVEKRNCDFTNRVQCDGDNSVEFASIVKFSDKRNLTAYYYQSQEELDACKGDLSRLNWEIHGFEID